LPYRLEDIIPILQQFPDADDKVVAALVKAKKVLGDAWDWGNTPLVGDSWSRSIKNPVGKFGAQMLEGMTSPLGAVGTFAGLGSAGAAMKGLYGLSKAGALVEAATNAPAVAQGVYTMAAGDTPGERGLGAVMAGLGGLGLKGSARTIQNARRGMRAIPKTMELYNQPDYMGSSVHPVEGDAVARGLDAWMTGGAGLQQYKLAPGAPMTEEALADFVNRNARAFSGKRHLGTWKDAEGRINLDISDPVPDLAAAKRLGVERGEYELFNPSNFEGVDLRSLPRAEREMLMSGYSKPTRFFPETEGNLSRAADLTGVERLALDETGAMGRNIRLTRSKSPGALRLDAARQHLGYELPEAVKRAQAGEPALIGREVAESLPEPTAAAGRSVLPTADPSGFAGGQAPAIRIARFGPEAQQIVDTLEMLKRGPYGDRYPQVDSLVRRIRSGSIGASPRNTALPQLVDPNNSPFAGLDFNQRTRLKGIVDVGPRKGSNLTDFSRQRLDALTGYADQFLDPNEIDWTTLDWMKKFATPQAADQFARKFSALSPQVAVRPDFRDAWSATLQERMGIPLEQWQTPFGHKASGFGYGLAETERGAKRAGMRRAVAGTGPISAVLPGKVDELYQLIIGNPEALPLDMHINRGLGNLADTPPNPVQYYLAKAAYNDFAKSRGFKGAAPHMAKSWSSVKHIVADHEPGFVELVNRVHAKFPELFKNFTPRSEKEFFDTMMYINKLIGQNSESASRFMAKRATPMLF
jgi:hypothetical protein